LLALNSEDAKKTRKSNPKSINMEYSSTPYTKFRNKIHNQKSKVLRNLIGPVKKTQERGALPTESK
jgi:hypothetical protein